MDNRLCTASSDCRGFHEQRMGKGVKFERIRRITGYLVGSLNTWNDAKKAEERDRVKHGVGGIGGGKHGPV